MRWSTRRPAQLSKSNVPRLSALLKNFSGPISSGINGFVGTAVARVVASPAMAKVWVAANRTAHAGLVKVLSGQGGGAIDVVNGKVTISLGPFIAQAEQALANQGFSLAAKLPAVNPTFAALRGTGPVQGAVGLPPPHHAEMGTAVPVARTARRGHLRCPRAATRAARRGTRGGGIHARPRRRARYRPRHLPEQRAASSCRPTRPPRCTTRLSGSSRTGCGCSLVVGLVVAAGAFFIGPSTAAVRRQAAQ